MLHVALGRFHQVRNEVVPAGQLDIDLGIGVLDTVSTDDKLVVHADDPEEQKNCDNTETNQDDEHDEDLLTQVDLTTVAKTGVTRMGQEPPAPDRHDDRQMKQSGFFARLHGHKEKAKHGFQLLKDHLAEESDETKSMLDIYRRSLEGKATKEELHGANEQFKDLIRIAGMGTFFGLVPGSMLLLPLAIAGANRVGIRLLPSSFVQKPDKGSGQDNPET